MFWSTKDNNFCCLDTTEIRLVTNAFKFAKSIAEMKLTDGELALFSAYTLLSPGKL